MQKSLRMVSILGSLSFAAGLLLTGCSAIASVDDDSSSSESLSSSRAASYVVSGSGISGTAGAGSSISNGSVTIKSAQGWLESAYVTWYGVSCDSYNVYYKSSSSSSWTKIDSMLTRKYSGYWRADIPGLAKGTYNLKVVPVKSGSETGTASTVTVQVASHDRSGFAFYGDTCPGAYTTSGTLKDNAVVLYITEDTKDSVTLDVTTSAKGATTTATGLQNILTAFKKGYDDRPLAIRLIGNVTDFSTMDNGDIMISGSGSSKLLANGITFEGIGDDATCNGWGLRIKNAQYVEVRNLGFMNCDSSEGDNVGLQQSDKNIWVHNCDMFYGQAGSDADQVKGDGALDCKKSTYVTFSYNHFFDNGKCNLLGLSEGTTSDLYITYHHNWYDHSDSRHPRVRYYSAHVYNNYYDGNAKYGAGSTLGSSVFMEANYFRNCKYPMLTSMQGSDLYASGTTRSTDNATFSKEAGGTIKAYNNTMTGTYTFIPYGASSYTVLGSTTTASAQGITTTADFDAYVVSSASTTVPSSVTSYSGSNTYNNFDTSSIMYSYTADSPSTAVTNVKKYAGRIEGGDFSWTFSESDDTSYSVDTSLKSALLSYTGSIAGYNGSVTSTADAVSSSDDSSNSSSDDSSSSSSESSESSSGSSSSESESSSSGSSESSSSSGSSSSSTASSTLNASDYSTTSLTSNTTYGDFTVLASSSKTVAIVSGYSTTYGGTTYTNAFDLKGGADGVAATYRAIKFSASAGATITAIVNANSSRTLQLSDGSSVVASASVSSTTSEFRYTTSTAGTFYLYSKSSALRVYAVSVSGAESSFETIEFNSDNLSHGQFTSNVTSGSFTVYATSAKKVSTPYASASLNGTSFSQSLNLGGAGSYGSYRTVQFDAAAGCTVTVYATGASGRYLALIDSTGSVVSKQATSSSIASYTFTTSDAGNYALASTGSAISIYYVKVSK